MIAVLLSVLLAAVPVWADCNPSQTATVTPRLGLKKPSYQMCRWDIPIQETFDNLDAQAASIYQANTWLNPQTFNDVSCQTLDVTTSLRVGGAYIDPLTLVRVDAPNVFTELQTFANGATFANAGTVIIARPLSVTAAAGSVGFDAPVTATSNATFSGPTVFTGTAAPLFQAPATFSYPVTVNAASTFSQPMTVTAAATFSQPVTVTGVATFTDRIVLVPGP